MYALGTVKLHSRVHFATNKPVGLVGSAFSLGGSDILIIFQFDVLYTSTPSWTLNPLPSVEILKLCNYFEVLICPQSLPFSGIPQQFQFEADSLPLPSLKCLEWNYNIVAAEPSGGVMNFPKNAMCNNTHIYNLILLYNPLFTLFFPLWFAI
ncbi:hypothetical protein GYMLUDRAFT_281287 [Collybiopsis luxurians FD-317 M1]|nr:hypothetical protein GYMLUDRAFT_281287 [Collybiopsis luxurians FD-317 M1]